MDAIQAIKDRRSVRTFRAQPVPRDVLLDLVDCARLAPSAMNQQGWEFVIITQPQTLARLGQLITHATFLPATPAAVAVFCRTSRFYVEDGSAATVNMLLAATAHGLASCWISGDKQPYADEVRQLLGAPADQNFFSLVALGYGAEEPQKEKRPLESVVHWEKF